VGKGPRSRLRCENAHTSASTAVCRPGTLAVARRPFLQFAAPAVSSGRSGVQRSPPGRVAAHRQHLAQLTLRWRKECDCANRAAGPEAGCSTSHRQLSTEGRATAQGPARPSFWSPRNVDADLQPGGGGQGHAPASGAGVAGVAGRGMGGRARDRDDAHGPTLRPRLLHAAHALGSACLRPPDRPPISGAGRPSQLALAQSLRNIHALQEVGR
jgi:hypothetical protein